MQGWRVILVVLGVYLGMGEGLRVVGASGSRVSTAPIPGPWEGRLVGALPTGLLPVAGGKDLNGDGLSDVAIGGPRENEGRGIVAVCFGGIHGLGGEPDWTYQGDGADRHAGGAVVLADVNGDGVGDLIVHEWDRLGAVRAVGDAASVLVFPGSRQGLAATPWRRMAGRIGRFTLRWNLVSAGDLNGDGREDLAMEGLDASSGTDGGLCVVVFLGSGDGLETAPLLVFHSEHADSNFGATLAAAGDVNGDGLGDLLVGATRYNGRYPEGGKVYLFLGSKQGVERKPAWTGEYPLSFDPREDGGGALFFGWGIGATGDVNGDGFGDVVIGAWNGSHEDSEEGLAFVYLGHRFGLSSVPVWTVEGNRPHVHLGASVRGVGDVNGDGYGDVAVGVPYASHGQKDEGVVALFYGSPHGLAADPGWTLDGDRSNGRMGEYVGTAGDVNGDGVPDLLLAGVGTGAEQAVLRPMVIYGRRGGLALSSEWSWRKPWTTAVGQWFSRVPRQKVWSGGVVCVALILAGLFWAHVRVRRELSRLIGENRRLAAMQERTRIARDMHDHLGADLTRLAAQLDRGSPNSGNASDTALLNTAQEAVKTLDELVWATNPTQDTLEGLAGYVTEYGPSYLNAHGLTCELDIPTKLPPVLLPSRARHELFLVVKEALRNVVQHARATRVRVALTADGGRLGLVVEDNGKGLTQEADGAAGPPSQEGGHGVRNPRGLGNGLANMRARATKLGGALSVSKLSQGGTRVLVEIPLDGGGKRTWSGI